MKNLKKLVIASFMLVIAFVAVVSSTYAWFTTGKDATVNEISVGVVDASKTMLIGREKDVWSKSVTVKPYGKITPVTLRSDAAGTVGMFQQLIWDSTLTPSFENATALTDEYVKTQDQSIQAGKDYYTLSVNDTTHVATFTKVATPNAENLATYYEQINAAKEYVKASGQYDSEAEYYTLSNNTYTKVTTSSSEDFANYYVKNEAYAKPEGYITFDLYFKLTVNDATDWANTSIQMDVTGLHAYNYDEHDQITNEENPRALSSFRLAVAENGTLAQLVEGVGTDMSGRYGEGPQFALSNGWLEMLNNATTGYIEKDTVNNKFVLADTYKDAFSAEDLYDAQDNADGVRQYDTGDAKFEYVMSCANGSNAEIVADRSLDGLTKTFKITIYVWMEGWDGDNVNAAASCQYVFGLSFRAN